jgi:nitroreductase
VSMETIKAIMTRRSVRQYRDRVLNRDQITKLLKAAMNAPSACNQQAWQFVVITDRKVMLGITKVHPYAQMLKTAACAIVVCGDPQAEVCPGYWVQDCAAATQNILLAAHALGLGAVWLGVHPQEQRVRDVRKLLGIPKAVVPLCIVSVGYPAKKTKPARRYSQRKVHYEQW